MKQSPSSEANTHSASQEIPRLSWNQTFHYRVHKRPPLIPILSQMHPVHTCLPYFLNIHFNIVFWVSLCCAFKQVLWRNIWRSYQQTCQQSYRRPGGVARGVLDVAL